MNQPKPPGTILLVEDSEDDAFLMKRALKKAGVPFRLEVVTDGKMALSYLEGTGEYQERIRFPIPDLIFLYLKLPFLNGFQVLGWIRQQAVLAAVPVIILTSSTEDQDREKADALGAPYLVKPPTPETLLNILCQAGFISAG